MGSANRSPDSRTPRRLTSMITRMQPSASATLWLRERRRRRGDREDAGRDRHGHRQHVVGEQRRAGDEARQRAEVVLGDDVGAAARLVRLDRLRVRDRDDREQRGDRDRDRQDQVERRRAGGEQHDHPGLGRVRDRGERVGREDRERQELREERLLHLAGRHRATDDRAPDRRPAGRRRPRRHRPPVVHAYATYARPRPAAALRRRSTITRQAACLRTWVAVPPSRTRPDVEKRCSPAITIRLAPMPLGRDRGSPGRPRAAARACACSRRRSARRAPRSARAGRAPARRSLPLLGGRRLRRAGTRAAPRARARRRAPPSAATSCAATAVACSDASRVGDGDDDASVLGGLGALPSRAPP